MSDKIVKIESEVVAGKAGLLDRALEEAPAVVKPSSLRPGAKDVFRFLKRVGANTSLHRIVLRVDNGDGSYGAIIGDLFPFKSNQSAEVLTAISNDLLGRAQADCDISGNESAYVVIAYSTSNLIDEVWFSLFPTGVVSADRGQGPDEIEALDDLPPPDDAYSILGEMLGKSPAFQEMIAKRAAATRPIMRAPKLTRPRDWQVPFERVRIAASKSATVISRVQAYFRGRRLICSVRKEDSVEQIVDNVYIDLRIGQQSQMNGPVAALFFSPGALGSDQNYDTAPPNLDISLTVRNDNDFTVVFDAVMSGQIVD